MIVECAGLPGSGKTTICKLVKLPHGAKGAIRLQDIRLDTALARASWKILLLCCGARPFTFDRLKRGINLVAFLRHYQYRGQVILLDQGQIQKLWSILTDADRYPSSRLQEVMVSLKPFAPEHVIWVETPVAVAIDRVIARAHGNSRYDKLPPESTHALLSTRAAMLKDIAKHYCLATEANLLQLNGGSAPSENATKIDAILGASS